MPFLRKKATSQFWFACFRMPDGTRADASTGTTSRRIARKIALGWEKPWRDKKRKLRLEEQQAQVKARLYGGQEPQPQEKRRDYGADIAVAVELHHVLPGREYPYHEFLSRAKIVRPGSINALQISMRASRKCPWRLRVRKEVMSVFVWLEAE